MLVGVVSDTHNNIKNIKNIIDIFNNEKVDIVIHTGDITQPKTLRIFSNLSCPMIGVFGNNDRSEKGLEEACKDLNFDFKDPPFSISLKNKKIVIFHEPDPINDFIKEHQDIKFFFLFSRRSDQNIINKINKEFNASDIVWSDENNKPYLALLGFSKYLICTSDSVSMISEAISSMTPVYIFRLRSSKSKNRIEDFNDFVISKGFARKLDWKLDEFKHDYTNETVIIAEKIINKFK